MKRIFIQVLFVVALVAMPSEALAAGLSSSQVSAILGLLRAFNAHETLIASVAAALVGVPAPAPVSPPPAAPPVRPDTTGSPYAAGSVGYDISFSTRDYPDDISFGFVVVGVTACTAFAHNERLSS